jgi:hypothetical protein
MDRQKRHVHIRKNQFDSTAALVYGLNVSLVHFTLFFVSFTIKKPDEDKAKQYDLEYGQHTVPKGDPFQQVTCH